MPRDRHQPLVINNRHCPRAAPSVPNIVLVTEDLDTIFHNRLHLRRALSYTTDHLGQRQQCGRVGGSKNLMYSPQ